MKFKALYAAPLALSLLLAGCVLEEDSSNTKVVKTENKSAAKKTESNKDQYYFKDGIVKIHDLQIEITKEKVIKAGEKGNEYGEKPVLAIWYKTTNLTDKEIDPTTAWIAVFKAIQDNNKNSVNELEVGGLPDERFLDSQTENIKKNGTVENAISYELDDLKTPVKLIATQGIDGKKLGEQIYKIK
ncbi:DUF5067 domain-containing protein [Rummeliibacillus sp. POC4]|uniref:DUF5067 domain-containing protein n=1 Tax=Rummeliibacillus sp. POC4 TaxID=2305899 RepID=UPI000E66B617|nr:DUF5067 domain-containing protein [Rummeliibacillus sp. POC4]RIJ64136.1 DUF5067 domain-containing protein [Rummeliibacillus sp. POC4]